MHCRHFRWRNINNKIIMSRFWPNSKPNIFVTRKFLIHIHREWILDISRPGQWGTLPLLAPSLETGQSVDIITDTPLKISCLYCLSAHSHMTFTQIIIIQLTFCLNLDKHQKMPQEMQSYMFRSVVTVLCVSRIMSQLWTIHLRISKGGIFEKQQPSSRFSLLPNCYTLTLWRACNYSNPYTDREVFLLF